MTLKVVCVCVCLLTVQGNKVVLPGMFVLHSRTKSQYKRMMIINLKGWNSSNIWEQTLTNQNSIQEEIKSKLESGNARYHLVQNIVPSILISQNIRF